MHAQNHAILVLIFNINISSVTDHEHLNYGHRPLPMVSERPWASQTMAIWPIHGHREAMGNIAMATSILPMGDGVAMVRDPMAMVKDLVAMVKEPSWP